MGSKARDKKWENVSEGGGERTKVTRENDAELDNREGKRNKKIYDKLCKLFKSEQKEDKKRKRKRKEKKQTRGGGRGGGGEGRGELR